MAAYTAGFMTNSTSGLTAYRDWRRLRAVRSTDEYYRTIIIFTFTLSYHREVTGYAQYTCRPTYTRVPDVSYPNLFVTRCIVPRAFRSLLQAFRTVQ